MLPYGGAFEDRFLTGRKYRRYIPTIWNITTVLRPSADYRAGGAGQTADRPAQPGHVFTGYHTEARLPHSGHMRCTDPGK